MKKKIIYFTKHTAAGPSSRYRSYNYFPYFEKAGYKIEVSPLFAPQYLEAFFKKGKKPLRYVVAGYLKRLLKLLRINNYDIIVIEYELFPFLPYFFEHVFLKGKRNIIIDYDDAVFHNYDRSTNFIVRKLTGNKIYKLVKLANTVITGSPYLTRTLGLYNKSVTEIPTSIQFEKYNTKTSTDEQKENEILKIGWIGSKTQSINIALLVSVLKKLQAKYTIKLVLLGFDHLLTHILDNVNYKLIEWRSETENKILNSFDVGIMPLEISDFNQGKCGFKLIQYMASGLPTISTPLEANIKIDRNGNNLFATNQDEWERAFETIIKNKAYYKNVVGKENKKIAQSFYSVEVNYKKYLGIFESI